MEGCWKAPLRKDRKGKKKKVEERAPVKKVGTERPYSPGVTAGRRRGLTKWKERADSRGDKEDLSTQGGTNVA